MILEILDYDPLKDKCFCRFRHNGKTLVRWVRGHLYQVYELGVRFGLEVDVEAEQFHLAVPRLN